MIRHVVMFEWNDDVDGDHVTAAGRALTELAAAIPEVVEYRHGPDLGVNDGNFDYVVVADFDSVDDYVVYRDHPDHQALIGEYVAGRVARRAAVQYEVS